MQFEMARRIFFLTMVTAFLVSFFGERAIATNGPSEDEKLIKVGVGAFQDGFFDIAEKQFSQFLQDYSDHPKWPDISYLLGKTLYYREKLKESRAQFLKILNESKSFEFTGHVLFWLAQIEFRFGNTEGARRYFLSILNRYPKFEYLDQVYYFLGLIEFAANRLLQAEPHFKKIAATTKSHDLIRASQFWLGILSYRQNRIEEASQLLKMVLQDPKPSPSFFFKYALLWFGELQLRQGKFDEAKHTYHLFLERYQEDDFIQEVHWKLGFCDYRMGNDKAAIEVFQNFKTQFKESPLLFYVHYLLGELYLRQSDHASSIKELNVILNRSRENQIWGVTFLSLFWNHLKQNDFSGAHKIFQRLQKLNHFDEEKALLQWINAEIAFAEGRIMDSLPYYFNILNTPYRERALFRIGMGYFFENQLREAITNLDILLLEFPNSVHLEETLFVKGECLVQGGNWTQAIDTYRLLIQKGKRPHWRLFAMIQLGNGHLSHLEVREAEWAFKEVIQEFPDHPLATHAAFQLGKLFFKQNNFLESIHYYSMILKGGRFEWLGGTYFSLGEIFYQQGRYDKAIKSFEMALRYLQENSPWFFLTHLEIGNLQRKDGKYEDAKRSYLTILHQAKDEDLKRAATDLLRLIEPK